MASSPTGTALKNSICAAVSCTPPNQPSPSPFKISAARRLSKSLPETQQQGATPFSPRCNKDLIEEALFARNRDLFSSLDIVFFETTPIYFEGGGGDTLGKRGNSKDHRPDLKQMVVGVVADGEGRPICCELWPSNTADVTTLLPIGEDGPDSGTRRYIVCHNENQAKKDAADREAIVASLKDKLKQGGKELVGNKGYRKYIKIQGKHFAIDEDKIKSEARYDGKWVLRTNTELSAQDVALKYKLLWMVEQIFRSTKSILETRPIWHKCDETIRGHVFCSFLALVLKTELYERLERKGHCYEWDGIRRDLEALQETELSIEDETYYLRTQLRGTCHDVLRAANAAIPPTLRQ